MNRADGFRFLAFALITGAFTVLIGLNIVKYSGDERMVLTATLEDVSGLIVGDAVEVSGVPVGNVTEIAVDDGMAVLTVEIDASMQLPTDTELAVRWLNLLGQREIQLYPGTASTFFNDGDEVTRTRSVVDIGEVINNLGPLAQSLDPAQINVLLTSITTMLEGNGDVVSKMLRDTDVLLATLQDRDQTFLSLVDDYGTIVTTLNQRDTQIQQMVDNLVLLAEAFQSSEDIIFDALGESAQLAVGLDRLLDRNADELDRIIGNLATVTGTAVERLDTVELALSQMPATLAGLFDSTNAGPFLDIDMTCLAPTPPPCSGGFVPSPGLSSMSLDDRAAFERLLMGEVDR